MTWFLWPRADKKLVVAIEGSVEEAKALYKPPEDSQGERLLLQHLCPAPSRQLLVLPPLAVHPLGLRGGGRGHLGAAAVSDGGAGCGQSPSAPRSLPLLSLSR